jgi:Protein of unknown function (DUF3073)
MGRGRAKAKQQKVARELKYSSHPTDLDALRRELAGGDDGHQSARSSTDDRDDGEDYEESDEWSR